MRMSKNDTILFYLWGGVVNDRFKQIHIKLKVALLIIRSDIAFLSDSA